MPAIGRSSTRPVPFLRSFLCAAIVLALLPCRHGWSAPDRSTDIRRRISDIATALTAGNPAQAMSPFDKSYSNYEKLSDYFTGLTGAFQVTNEVDVTDEQEGPSETTLTVHWVLTLTDLATNYTENRTADIDVRLIQKDGKWRIADFAPIEIFNPRQTKPPQR